MTRWTYSPPAPREPSFRFKCVSRYWQGWTIARIASALNVAEDQVEGALFTRTNAVHWLDMDGVTV